MYSSEEWIDEDFIFWFSDSKPLDFDFKADK